jgi:tripartite-type tricarboxylate transporter receptor subunit TctC
MTSSAGEERVRTLPIMAAELACCLFLGWLAVNPVQAQQWPAKASRVVLGMTAGGSADLLARLVAQRLA